MNDILVVNHVNAYYKDQSSHLFLKKKKKVCNDICFSVREGEILGLLGESGCGKSTLAKTILHMLPDFDGEIVHYSQFPQFVFQDPYSSLNPAKKVGWILQEPLKVKGGYSKKERESKVTQMLKRVGLTEEYANRYPKQLSGGQRQRVCIAFALMLEPKLLIADEPVSALDVTIQAQIMELLQTLQKDMNLAILFISHDLKVVYQMCDRVMIMKQGEIIEMGNKDEVYFSPKHSYTKTLLESAGIR